MGTPNHSPESETAETALELAAAHRPRVALVDITLEGARDGIAVAEEISRRHGTVIVFLSGNAQARHDPRVAAVNPAAFLSKPYFAAELEAALAKAFAV